MTRFHPRPYYFIGLIAISLGCASEYDTEIVDQSDAGPDPIPDIDSGTDGDAGTGSDAAADPAGNDRLGSGMDCDGEPPRISGKLRTQIANIEFNEATVSVTHNRDTDEAVDGCVTGLEIHLSHNGGCQLKIVVDDLFLERGTSNISEVVFSPDIYCKSFYAAGFGTYRNTGGLRVAEIWSDNMEVPGQNVAGSCLVSTLSIRLEGVLTRDGETGTGLEKGLDIYDSLMMLSGEFPSVGASGLTCPMLCEDIIKEGGFEGGPAAGFWRGSSENFSSPICSEAECGGNGGGTGAHEGSYWGWFGGNTSRSENSSIGQFIVIPSGIGLLAFRLEIPSCNKYSDKLAVVFDNDYANPIAEIFGDDVLCDKVGYVRRGFDVSGYADGEEHYVAFLSSLSAGSGEPTNFMIDDVALTACQRTAIAP